MTFVGRAVVFAPKVAKPLAKTTDVSTSGTGRQRQPAEVEQIRPTMDGGPTPRNLAWDFSTIPVSQHEDVGVADPLTRMPGEPLGPETRRMAEERFRHDFGNVRVHRGPEANAAALAVGAPAFTLGRHIVARDGAIDPATSVGHAMLVHELIHIVQQAAFGDRDLAGGLVLDAEHFSEQQARAGIATPSPLEAPAIQRGPANIVISKQHLEIDLTNSAWRQTLEFEGGQTQIVYVLRDATTGEFLKVGKTTVGAIASRFGEYVAAGNKWSRKLVADVWTIRARSKTNVEAFEQAVRAGLESIGARLPWDNSRVPGKGPRQGRPGQGVPDTKSQTETQFIDEAEQLRVKHADPNIPKRRGMSSREKAKLQATEDRAAADAVAKLEQAATADKPSTGPRADKIPGKAEVKSGGDASPPKPVQTDKVPASDPVTVSGKRPAIEPKVETPPIGEGGGGAARIGIKAFRFRSAGRLLAEEAPGLLLQVGLMLLFPPEVRIHAENYDDLRKKKIDPVQQAALTQQEVAFNKLVDDDATQSIWAIVTVRLDFGVEATPGGDLEISLQDLQFIGMKLSREYLLVQGKKFDLAQGKRAYKMVIYSVPIYGPATHGSEEPIRRYRKVRESLTYDSYKVRISAILAMYKIADANQFLKSQLIRDLQGMSNDENDLVKDIVARLLGSLRSAP